MEPGEARVPVLAGHLAALPRKESQSDAKAAKKGNRAKKPPRDGFLVGVGHCPKRSLSHVPRNGNGIKKQKPSQPHKKLREEESRERLLREDAPQKGPDRRDRPIGRRDRQPGAVIESPRDEIPGRPVPQSDQAKSDEPVENPPKDAPSVPPERNVDIVAHPAAERDMPPLPEVPDVSRKIGPVEIFRQTDPQKARRADRDIGITRKIH